MTPSCTVLIASPQVMAAFRQRARVTDGEVLTFSDTEPLHALEAITTRRPRLVALERLFAATPRGTALINRLKADATLADTEIRVLAHDSDYCRVLPRPVPTAPGAAAVPIASPPVAIGAPAPAPRHDAAPTATLEPQALDPRGTRRAPRFKVVGKTELLVDGKPATLVEMSTFGVQVVSPTILKPNQRVRLTLSDDEGAIRCNGTIAWAEFQIPPKVAPHYRAGIEFVDADPSAVDAFCERHRA